MGQAWYYTRGGQQTGPVEFSQLQQLAASGQLNPAELVWCEGMPQWSAASTIPGLMPAGAPVPASPYAAQTSYGAAPSPYANPGALNYYTPVPGQAIYAGFWLRFGAAIIDGIIVGVVNNILGYIVGLMIGTALRGGGTAVSEIMLIAQGVAFCISITVSWLYFALQESSQAQATLGKRACSIKVVDLSGQRITFGRATGRYFSKIPSALIFAIGYIMAGFTEKKQALHDMMAGTLVIRS